MKYLIQATGRRAGAQGINFPLAVIIEAASPNAAVLKAYDHVEHLLGVKVSELSKSSLDGRRELVHEDI